MGSVVQLLQPRTVSCGTLRARRLVGAPWVLELTGEADIATLALLRQELSLLVASGREDIVVDVSGLVFCDVASAHLIRTVRRSSPLTLVGASRSVKRVCDLVDALRVQRVTSYSSLTAVG